MTCDATASDALFPCTPQPPLNVDALRRDFPILSREMNGRPLVYLDTAASAQKPRAVLEAMNRFYEQDYANIHRGVYLLSQRATIAYERARERVRQFLNAHDAHEIVFTRGATEAINLVAQSWGRTNLKAGDEVVLTELEHHANIVPWQMLREQIGITLRIVPIQDSGELRLEDIEAAMTPRTRLVAVAHVSNALGTVLPVEEISALCRTRGIALLLDGCQAVGHGPVDVARLGCDFYVFSGHKIYGPTGIGVLYGKQEHLRAMQPWQGGGDMIEEVSFERTTYAAPPARFEAGTPPIAEAVGLHAALDYVAVLGMKRIAAHEHALLQAATERLSRIPGLRIVGTAPDKAAILSFVLNGAHPHDIGTILDHHGVAVRAGHHCAQPLMHRLGLVGTTRASFALYNTMDDVEALGRAVEEVGRMFG